MQQIYPGDQSLLCTLIHMNSVRVLENVQTLQLSSTHVQVAWGQAYLAVTATEHSATYLNDSEEWNSGQAEQVIIRPWEPPGSGIVQHFCDEEPFPF